MTYPQDVGSNECVKYKLERVTLWTVGSMWLFSSEDLRGPVTKTTNLGN